MLTCATIFAAISFLAATKPHPRFMNPISNITVPVGKDALLKCRVENLNGHKVAWLNVKTQTILTIHRHIISRNPRIGLVHDDHHQWDLKIASIREDDRGQYMCQINTDPMLSQTGVIDVVVSPDITDVGGNPDLVVREGSNISVNCKVKGYPVPKVHWKREDGSAVKLDNSEVFVIKGNFLNITKVSRLHMGSYVCIASNGIPPSVSKKLILEVQFPPMIWVQNQREGAHINDDVTISCYSEAFPESINFWANETGSMLIPSPKYTMNITNYSYKVFMSLHIRQIRKSDFQVYKCIAKNSLGDTDGIIKLYDTSDAYSLTSTALKAYPSLRLGTDDYDEDNSERENDIMVISNRKEALWNTGIKLPLNAYLYVDILCLTFFMV